MDETPRIADAAPGNWVDRHAPAAARPYLRLARFDRPIGAWLLLLPGWWAIALAAEPGGWPDWRLMLLFFIGAFVMRGAGCVLNDIADRDFDGRVERTRHRPLPSGQVTVLQAFLWLGLLCLIGLAVLLQLNLLCFWLGLVGLFLATIYPFMKRFTWWPQFFLGLAFNWGAVMGWAAARDDLAWPCWLLYAAGIAWTLGYDTIYAHQDKEDDALIGVKSTARLFGANSRPWLRGFYTVTLAGLGAAGFMAGLGFVFFLGLLGVAAHLAWQVAALRLDDPADCLAKFRANKQLGLLVLVIIVGGKFL